MGIYSCVGKGIDLPVPRKLPPSSALVVRAGDRVFGSYT
jgi:hypothetical protein